MASPAMRICLELNLEAKASKLPIPFPSVKCYVIEFESMDEAKYWITLNQNSRRNLTDVQRTFQMGQLYNSLQTKEKVVAYLSARGDSDKVSNEQLVKDQGWRSVLLSKHFNVNEKTVRRAADYALGIDRIRQSNETIATAILRGEKVDQIDFSQKVVMEIGQLEPKEFRALKWKDAPTLVGALKGEKGKASPAKEKSASQAVKDAVGEFLTSPSADNLERAHKLMKDYLAKSGSGSLKVAS